MIRITREAPAHGVYTPDLVSGKPERYAPNAPVMQYNGYIDPTKDADARKRGDAVAQAILANRIADFERSPENCEKNGESDPDLMVHVSTFLYLNGFIYVTYYANRSTTAEDPNHQEARLAFCPQDDPADLTVVTIQSEGDLLDGKKITRVYDTILLYKGGDELYILWTAAPEGNYYRLYCTFNVKTNTLGPIRANRFKAGNVTNDFSMTGIRAALAANGIPLKAMWSDIGIMQQKLTSRVENGETWYYSGTYSGNWNALIRSRDLVTWEYVSAPDFVNYSQWENAVYVDGDKVWYFVRQNECMQGFLTRYDLVTGTWDTPTLIRDTQSRSDFFEWRGELYLVHAPADRNGFGIVRIDRNDPAKSLPAAVVDMKSSLFYPYTTVRGDDLYISYTVDRKHIRLSKFDLKLILA